MVYSYNGIKRNRLLIDQQEYSKMLNKRSITHTRKTQNACRIILFFLSSRTDKSNLWWKIIRTMIYLERLVVGKGQADALQGNSSIPFINRDLVIRVHAFIKIYNMLHLRFMHWVLFNIYLKGKKNIFNSDDMYVEVFREVMY